MAEDTNDLGFLFPVASPLVSPVYKQVFRPRVSPLDFGRAAARQGATRVGVGGALRIGGRFIPYVGAAIIAYELYQWFTTPKLAGWPKLPPGWSWCSGPGTANATPCTLFTFHYGPAFFAAQGACATTVDLCQQSGIGGGIGPSTTTSYWARKYHRGGAINAPFHIVSGAVTKAGGTPAYPIPTTTPAVWPTTLMPPHLQPANPNHLRWQPSPRQRPGVGFAEPVPQELLDPIPEAQAWVDVTFTTPALGGSVVGRPWRGMPRPSRPPSPSPRPRVRPGPGVSPAPGPVTGPAPQPPTPAPVVDPAPATQPVLNPPPPRYVRAPASSGTREPPKAVSKSKAVAIAVARAFGTASEAGDLVDSVFKALPKDVQKRWKKANPERMIDEAGQYGISGIDWKLLAIWHNYDKLDTAQAFVNIVQNEIEDQFVGRSMAAQRRLTGRGRNRNLRAHTRDLYGKKGR